MVAVNAVGDGDRSNLAYGTLGLRMTKPASEGQVVGYLVQWKSGDEEYDDTDTSKRQADVPGSGDREHTITGLDNGVSMPSSEVKGTPEPPPNSPARGRAHHQRDGPGGRDADGRNVGHRRRRRAGQRELLLPVDCRGN